MSILDEMSAKYLWWKTGDNSPHAPHRIIAQLMNIGTWDDVVLVLDEIGEEPFREVLARAEAGWLDLRSWSYWHYRLGIVAPGEPVPPLPRRTFGESIVGC